MEIYIVRHGETVWNKKKLLQGRTDIELSDKGRELARITGENLRDTHFDMVFPVRLRGLTRQPASLSAAGTFQL